MQQKRRLDYDEIVKLTNEPLKEGDHWYLIDKKWYDVCQEYHKTGDESVFPGPIDNSALFPKKPTESTKKASHSLVTTTSPTSSTSTGALTSVSSSSSSVDSTVKAEASSSAHPTSDSSTEATDKEKSLSIDCSPIRKDCSESNGDFIAVPEKCWNLLKETYGIISENHTVKRRAYSCSGLPFLEIFPLDLTLCLYGGKEPAVNKFYSRLTTLAEIERELRRKFNIDPSREARLWVDSTVYTLKPGTGPVLPSKSESNIQANSSAPATTTTAPASSTSPIKPPPTPPPMSTKSPTIITRQTANSMSKQLQQQQQQPIALPDSTSVLTRTSNLSTSVSDSPIGSVTSSSPNSTPSTNSSKQPTVSEPTSANVPLADVVSGTLAIVTLEVINADGTWPSSRPRYGTVSTRSSKAQPGLCGLSNLGNTCFMNSALQCLSNTPPLTNYILTDKFVDDINVNNPLGMHGEIARTYADLIKVMWSGNNTSFMPREFKCAVSRFAPQFNGFAQQDCQELMAFLLDGLHEDLNRIKNKPYIEIKNDIERRPDEVVAAESWSNYKKRNDSIVVDTFHAMLKSTLVCPGCQLVSVTFDPFCYLSLPLLVKREKQVKLIFLSAPRELNEELIKPVLERLDPEEVKNIRQYGASISSFGDAIEQAGGYHDPDYNPRSCKLQVPRSGPVSEICELVARVMNEQFANKSIGGRGNRCPIQANRLVVAELTTDGRISKVYESNEHFNQISDDIVVVEKKLDYVLPLYIRDRKGKNAMVGSVIGTPVFLHVANIKFDTVYKSILASLSNLTSSELHDSLQFHSYANWHKIIAPTESPPIKKGLELNSNSSANLQMDYTNDNENENRSQGDDCEMSIDDGDDSESDDKIETTNGDSSSTKSNGGPVTSSSSANKKKAVPIGSAFDLSTVNSYGNYAIEIHKPGGIISDYSSRLYLGITFNSPKVLPQLAHLLEPSSAVEFFTPNVLPKPTLQLEDCIRQFTNVERLGADDPWYCPKCKKHQQATKKFDIWSLPKILIIHLKRFSFSRSWRDKIDSLVEFPVVDLDMTKYVLNPSQKNQRMKYNLIGVANHFGGLGGGHYTAYAKNALQDAWYSFDDTLVTQTSANNVVTRSAYVLFYQLQEPDTNIVAPPPPPVVVGSTAP